MFIVLDRPCRGSKGLVLLLTKSRRRDFCFFELCVRQTVQESDFLLYNLSTTRGEGGSKSQPVCEGGSGQARVARVARAAQAAPAAKTLCFTRCCAQMLQKPCVFHDFVRTCCENLVFFMVL